jgi:uncharacterized protein
MNCTVDEVFVLHRRLATGQSCAVNLTNPGGVLLLNQEETSALDSMIDTDGRLLKHPSIYDGPPAHSVARRLNFRGTGNALVALSAKVPKTLTVWVHTSSACNLSCSYCYIPQLRKALTPERAAPYLMPEQVSSAMVSGLIAVCQEGGFRRLSLKFAGGEPTLNWTEVLRTCDEATRACEAAGIEPTFRMLTNGVFRPDEVIPGIRAHNIRISISVDGDPDAHDEVRFVTPQVFEIYMANEKTMDILRPKRRGSWSIVKANIDRLLDAGSRPYVMCTLDERNYAGLGELAGYCAEKNLGFRLSPVRDSSTYKLPGIQDAITREMIWLYRSLGEEHPIDLPIGSHARFAEWDFSKRKGNSCAACRSLLAVGERGQAASCQMRLDRPVASVQDETFGHFFETIRKLEDYRYFVHPEAKSGKCSGCSFKYICAGGCPEHTRMAFGTTNHASPWCDLFTATMPEFVEAIGRQLERKQSAARLSESGSAYRQQTPSMAAQWYSDPSGRHEYRYWNGASWTDGIANNGQAGKDALAGAF